MARARVAARHACACRQAALLDAWAAGPGRAPLAVRSRRRDADARAGRLAHRIPVLGRLRRALATTHTRRERRYARTHRRRFVVVRPMMDEMQTPLGTAKPWPAPAKLNLCLHIVGRRPDGYHLLQSALQFIDLADALRFYRRPAGIIERIAGPGEIP